MCVYVRYTLPFNDAVSLFLFSKLWYHKHWTNTPAAQLLCISAAVETHFGVLLHLILPRLFVWSVSLLHSLLFTPLKPVVSLLFLFVFSLWRDERNNIAGDKIMKGEWEDNIWAVNPDHEHLPFPLSVCLSSQCLSPSLMSPLPLSLTPVFLDHPLPHPIPFSPFLSDDWVPTITLKVLVFAGCRCL